MTAHPGRECTFRSHHDATIIEVCVDCRGTIGDQLGLNLKLAPDKGAFGTRVCHACASTLDLAGLGMDSITPGGVWWTCPHLTESRRQAIDRLE